jgi:MFS family permease
MPPKPNNRLFWVFSLSAAVYFIQGIEALPSQGLFYYLKESLHYSPEKIMFLTSLTTLAWLVKPIIGYFIDNFLTKKIWIFLSLGLDIILVLILGLISLPVGVLIGFILFNSTDAAFRDVAVDGIMCVEGKAHRATGKIQSVQWMAISLAGIISGIAGGYIAYRWDYRFAFLCLIPFYLLAGGTAYLYRADKPGEARYKYLFKELKQLFLNRQLMLVCLFIFLYRYSPSFGTPLFFIQRDTFKWGKVWIGALSTIGTGFGILGSLLYYKYSSRINIKKWLYWSVFLGALTTLSYLYYTPITAVAYDIVYSFIGMFIFIMVMDLMARSTINGLEATSFALLCSFSNLSLTASNLSGAWLLPILGLKWLIIISALTSFLCLPLIRKIQA